MIYTKGEAKGTLLIKDIEYTISPYLIDLEHLNILNPTDVTFSNEKQDHIETTEL